MTYRNRAYLDDAEGRECIRCGASASTVCARHYNGLRQHAFGKGRGIKCDDLLTADFCMSCDAEFSEGEGGRKSIDRSEEFMFWCWQTLRRRIASGWELKRVRA